MNNEIIKILHEAKKLDTTNGIYNIFKLHPFLIADLEEATSFLLSRITNEQKCDILLNIIGLIEKEKKERNHSKGYKKDIAKKYEDWKYKTILKKNEFIVLYNSLTKIVVNNYCPNAISSEILNTLSLITDDEEIKVKVLLEIVHQIKEKRIDFKRIAYDHLDYSKVEKKIKLLSQLFQFIKKGDYRKNIFDTVSALTINPFENDLTIENKIIFNIVKSKIDTIKNTVLYVIDANTEFIKRMCADILYENCNIVYIMKNQNLANICADIIEHNKNHVFIGADRINDYALYSKEQTVSTLFFHNHHSFNTSGIEKINIAIKELSTKRQMMIEFDSDHNIINSINKEKIRISYIDSIHFFPFGIKNESIPKKKCLVIYDVTSIKQKVSLHHYSLESTNDGQFINFNPFVCKQDKIDNMFYNGLRNAYNSPERENLKLTSDTRNKANIIPFSRYIDIYYTIAADGRVKAYLKYDGKVIKESEKVYRSISYEDALNWVKTEYMFGTKGRGKSGYQIIDVASELYKNNLKDNNLDFNSLIVLYPELIKNSNKEVVKKISSSDVGNILINEISDEIVDNVLLDEKSDIKKKVEIIKAISEILDFAIRKGHITKNGLKKSLNDNNKNMYKLQKLRQALVQRNLSEDNYKDIYEICIKEIDKNKSAYIGVLLKVFTPLDYDQICALRLNDIKLTNTFNEDEKVVYVDIYKRVEHKDQEIVITKLRSPEHYRKVVVPSIVAKPLLDYISQQKSDKLNNSSLLLVNRNKVSNEYYSPRELSKLCRSLLMKIDKDREIIKLFDANQGEFIEEDLSYNGDYLRASLKYYILSDKICNFSNNEMNYYFGIKQKITHAKNYVDFECDGALLKQHLKLRSLERMVKTNKMLEGRCHINGEKLSILRTGNNNFKYNYHIKTTNYFDYLIKLENKYGMDMIIYKGEE